MTNVQFGFATFNFELCGFRSPAAYPDLGLSGLFVLSFFKKKLNKNSYFYAKEKHVRRWWLKFLAARSNVIDIHNNNITSCGKK